MRLLPERVPHDRRRAAERVAAPTEAQIRQELGSLQCRCGTHMRYIRAIKRAAGLKTGSGSITNYTGMREG